MIYICASQALNILEHETGIWFHDVSIDKGFMEQEVSQTIAYHKYNVPIFSKMLPGNPCLHGQRVALQIDCFI